MSVGHKPCPRRLDRRRRREANQKHRVRCVLSAILDLQREKEESRNDQQVADLLPPHACRLHRCTRPTTSITSITSTSSSSPLCELTLKAEAATKPPSTTATKGGDNKDEPKSSFELYQDYLGKQKEKCLPRSIREEEAASPLRSVMCENLKDTLKMP